MIEQLTEFLNKTFNDYYRLSLGFGRQYIIKIDDHSDKKVPEKMLHLIIKSIEKDEIKSYRISRDYSCFGIQLLSGASMALYPYDNGVHHTDYMKLN